MSTTNLDIENVFPSFELLQPTDPDADTAAAESSGDLLGINATGTATITAGVVTAIAVDLKGLHYTTPPVVTLAAPPSAAAVPAEPATATIDTDGNGSAVLLDATITIGNSLPGGSNVVLTAKNAENTGSLEFKRDGTWVQISASILACIGDAAAAGISAAQVGTALITITQDTDGDFAGTVVLVGDTSLVIGSPFSGGVDALPASSTATATAALYASSGANRGKVTSITVADGGARYATAPAVTIGGVTANQNTIEKIAKLGADQATGADTFNYAKDYIAIALSDLDVTTANLFTAVEGAEDAGDFRKLMYHFIRAYHEYLKDQESVVTAAYVTADSTVIVAAGTNYTTGDAVVLSGGSGSGATASITAVDGATGAITGFTVSAGGTGYSSSPSVSITSTSGAGASISLPLTANEPAKFDVTKGFLSENTVTDELTRSYTATFTFEETGLEMAPE